MSTSNMNLDDAASELYQQLEGLDAQQLENVSLTGDGFSQGLTEAELRNDATLMLLADFVSQVSLCLMRSRSGKKRSLQSSSFGSLKDIIKKLNYHYSQTRNILIRYKGGYEETGSRENIDYEIVFGKHCLDQARMEALSRRRGIKDGSRNKQLADAFEIFWSCSVSNLLLRLPHAPQEFKRLWIGLQILYRYFRALQKKSPVQFKMGGKQLSYPVVKNENGKPDPNLTLLAIFNKLSSAKVQKLVDKVTHMLEQSEAGRARFAFTTAYDALLELKSMKKKWNLPPLELNNVKWLVIDDEWGKVSDDMARVARYVANNFGDSAPKASGMLQSVYGNDYEKIDSNQVAHRLGLTSDLLNKMDSEKDTQKVEAEVLENVSTRLGDVNDNIYDNLIVEENRIEAHAPGKKTLIAKVHDKLIGTVSFYKDRSVTKRKMTDMIHQMIDFDQQDYETIARDFEIRVEQATALIRTLKSCFDADGNFQKSVFVNAIPDLERYESKIFDFLWHNLKETLHQADRAAFLDSLQMLVDRIRQRKKSLSVLLKDLSSNPGVVRFADHKAFMLGNRLLRKYSGNVVSYQITPEDVLKDSSGLDQAVADYVAWKIERDQEPYFTKMRTIHLRLMELLDYDGKEPPLMTAKDLFALEREAYLFFAQSGGNTGWTILMSALKEYGNPDSEIYRLKDGKRHLADLLQLLKIVIRGVGSVGQGEERSLIESVINRLDAFSGQADTMHLEDLILQIREAADETVRQLDARTA